MKKYYLDVCYRSDPFGDIVSYECGIFDDVLFDTYEEAEEYEAENLYRLGEKELFSISEIELKDDKEPVDNKMTLGTFLSHIKHKTLNIKVVTFEDDEQIFEGSCGTWHYWKDKCLFEHYSIAMINPFEDFLEIYILEA